MKDILSQKRVLITGGAGFIGTNLIRELLRLKYDVNLILKETSDCWRIEDILSKIKIYHVDLLDKKKLTKIVNAISPNFIIHLATYSDYRRQDNVEEMVNINIKGTLNLLLASKDIDYKLFVNTGSSSEYGIKNEAMSEFDALNPISFYAATKASATYLCQVFSNEYHKPIVTLRPFSIYGPYENETRFVPTIIKSVIENKPIKLTSGNQRRDFIYVKDVVDIYIKALSCRKNLSGHILNMGTGVEYTNDEVVKMLFEVANNKVKVKKGAFPKRLWDTSHWVANISKTTRILGWKSHYTLSEGLRETYGWHKNKHEK
jgi:nucleoside-diphosphate-sugar epimerase